MDYSNILITMDFQSFLNVYNAGFQHGVNEGMFPKHGTYDEAKNVLNGHYLCDDGGYPATGVYISRQIQETTRQEVIDFVNEFKIKKLTRNGENEGEERA